MSIEVILILVLLSIVACGIIIASTFPHPTWWQKASLMIVYGAAGVQMGAVVVYLVEFTKQYFK